MVIRKALHLRRAQNPTMPSATRPLLLLHPLVIFSLVWLGVVFLYSLHLSMLLQYTTAEATFAILTIWFPFFFLVCAYTLSRHYFGFASASRIQRPRKVNYRLLRRRLKSCLRIWIVVTIFEVIASGGVPLLWALTGSSKKYIDFGISSLHGLVISLETAIALCYFALFLMTGKYRDLRIPVLFVCWSVIIINRNMMLVTLLEFCIVYLRLKKLRSKTVLQLVAGACILVLVFGVIGDVRQGSEGMIRDLAQPTDDYPEWLPSGVLWGYIYITTPINNLIYNIKETHPVNDPLFPSTVSTLFPSVIRTIVYGNKSGDAESGQLVVSAFNVSTAYVGPYQDFGYIGMGLFSVMTAFTCLFFWFRDDLRNVLMYAVVSQCLVFTLFFDHFFYLPVIMQLGWLWYFFLPRIRFGRRRGTTVQLMPLQTLSGTQ